MKFYNYLQEKRSHPDQNPKVSIIDALRPYKNRDDVYISYTDINKLGINPINKFKTPTAIYSYPLKEIWNKIVDNTVPFASDKKYVQVFSCPNSKVTECINYTYNDLDKDINKLIKILPKIYKKEMKPLLGNSSIKDYVLKIHNRSDLFCSFKHPFNMFWWTTMTLSNHLTFSKKEKQSKFTSKAVNIWAKILRELGYYSFSDKQGEGFIHKNEPIQALFLSTKHIKHIDSVLNKKYEKHDCSSVEELMFLLQN